jgi:6-phosphogluconolactonase (cycloisomerase 2 family)
MDRQVSRRSFLEGAGHALTAAGLGGATLVARAQPSGQLFAYVGKSTPGFLGGPEGGGIEAYRVDMADGSLEHIGSTGPEAQDLNSESMCVSMDQRFLYCANRTNALNGMPGTGAVSSRSRSIARTVPCGT